MSYSLILSLILSFTLSECHVSKRILNGEEADPGQFPYQAFITNVDGSFCGASVIHKRWLLTAAHCYQAPETNPKVVVGTTFFSTAVSGAARSYAVERFFVHEDFVVKAEAENDGLEYVVNDIALVRVTKPIKFTRNIRPVKLAMNSNDSYENVEATLAGWGKTAYNRHNPLYLRYVDLRVTTQKECRRVWTYVDKKHLCTSTKEKRGACYGDSGGPLVTKDGLQIGIVSTADTYCESLKPDLYTKVSAFVPWIRKKLAIYNDRL